MDRFKYELRMQELPKLTTKKAKAKFLLDVKKGLTVYAATPFLAIKLASETLKYFKDSNIAGSYTLTTMLNKSIYHAQLTKAELEDLGELPYSDVNNYGDYENFMYSAGIPAYLKVAVLKAIRDNI